MGDVFIKNTFKSNFILEDYLLVTLNNKLTSIESYFAKGMSKHVIVNQYHKKFEISLAIRVEKKSFKCTVKHTYLNTALNLAVDKIERQIYKIRKRKNTLERHKRDIGYVNYALYDLYEDLSYYDFDNSKERDFCVKNYDTYFYLFKND